MYIYERRNTENTCSSIQLIGIGTVFDIYPPSRSQSFAHKCSFGNSYTMSSPPVRGDNPRALASGLSYVQVDKHGITILYHQHQCRRCTSRDI